MVGKGLKEIYQIPVLLLNDLYGDQTSLLYLPPVPPYIVDHEPSPMLEISKFYVITSFLVFTKLPFKL